MKIPFGPAGKLVSRARHEVDETLRRAGNGVRVLAGLDEVALGQTPRQAVWRRDRVTLSRYTSGSPRRSVPVLIVMSLVTKPAIFDLRPGMSFVELLLADGFDVYLLDWGVPTVADADNSLETYVDDYLPKAADAVLRQSGAEELGMLGYCLGGTLSLLTAAGHPDLPVSNLLLVSTPIDFSQMGPISTMLRRGGVKIDNVVDETGNVPPSWIASSIKLVKPTGDVTTFVNLWESLPHSGRLTAHRALMSWARDHIPFPGAAARQLVELCVHRNLLTTGTLPLGGRTVELSAITCPVLNLHGDHDNLVPPAANAPLREVLSGAEVTDVHVPTGHVGLFFGRQATKIATPTMLDWLRTHSPEHDAEQESKCPS